MADEFGPAFKGWLGLQKEIESSNNPNAVTKTKDGTGDRYGSHQLSRQMFDAYNQGGNIFKDEDNELAAGRALGQYLDKYQDPVLASIAYHAGEPALDTWLKTGQRPPQIGPLTERYAQRFGQTELGWRALEERRLAQGWTYGDEQQETQPKQNEETTFWGQLKAGAGHAFSGNPRGIGDLLQGIGVFSGNEWFKKKGQEWIDEANKPGSGEKISTPGVEDIWAGFDRKTASNLVDYLGASIGEAIGSSLTPAVGGAVGGAIGAGAGLVSPVPGGAAMGYMVGSRAGAAGPSWLLNYSDVLNGIKDELKIAGVNVPEEEVYRNAMLAAVPIAALDVAALEAVLTPAGITKKAVIGEAKKRVIATIVKSLAAGARYEAITEGVQQAIQEVTAAFTSGEPIIDAKRGMNILNASVKGAIGGFVLRSPAAVIEGVSGSRPQVPGAKVYEEGGAPGGESPRGGEPPGARGEEEPPPDRRVAEVITPAEEMPVEVPAGVVQPPEAVPAGIPAAAAPEAPAARPEGPAVAPAAPVTMPEAAPRESLGVEAPVGGTPAPQTTAPAVTPREGLVGVPPEQITTPQVVEPIVPEATPQPVVEPPSMEAPTGVPETMPQEQVALENRRLQAMASARAIVDELRGREGQQQISKQDLMEEIPGITEEEANLLFGQLKLEGRISQRGVVTRGEPQLRPQSMQRGTPVDLVYGDGTVGRATYIGTREDGRAGYRLAEGPTIYPAPEAVGVRLAPAGELTPYQQARAEVERIYEGYDISPEDVDAIASRAVRKGITPLEAAEEISAEQAPIEEEAPAKEQPKVTPAQRIKKRAAKRREPKKPSAPPEEKPLFHTVQLRKGKETLRKYGILQGKSYKTRQIAEALEMRQREKFGMIERNDRSIGAMRKIASWMVAEVKHEFASSEDSGVGWYSTKTQRAIDNFGRLFPELTSDERAKQSNLPGVNMLGSKKNARDMFTLILAITSDGEKVKSNFEVARDIYEHFRETGEMKFPKRFRGNIGENLKKVDTMLREMGPGLMHEWLLTEKTISDLNKEAKVSDQAAATGYPAGAVMPQSVIVLGPKIGAFYANLMGAHGYLTMDRWWSRTFNRYRGTLLPRVPEGYVKGKPIGTTRFRELIGEPDISHEEAIYRTIPYVEAYAAKKYKDGTEIERAANTIYKLAFTELQDQPFNVSDRAFMIDAVKEAQKRLKRSGVDVTVADVQAILWYYEKRLYGELGARKTADISYEEIARQVVDEKLGAEADHRPASTSTTGTVEGPDGGLFDVEEEAPRPKGKPKLYQIARPAREGHPETAPGPYVRRAEEVPRHSLGADAEAYYELSAYDQAKIRQKGGTPLGFIELKRGEKAGGAFQKLIAASKEASPFGAAVHVYPKEDYAKMRTFSTPDGMFGFALHGDDIVSVFRHPKADIKRGTLSALSLAIQNGGRRLDAFDTVLPHLYSENGFKAVARLKWNDEYAPDGWDYDQFGRFNGGRPDVVFMTWDPDYRRPYQVGDGVPVTEYEDAVRLQEASLAKDMRFSAPTLFHAAWHGSPHEFEKFSTEHIGKGEGAQAYGWGLYFASRRGIAEFYQGKLAQKADLDQERWNADPVYRAAIIVDTHRGDENAAIGTLMGNIQRTENKAVIKKSQDAINAIESGEYKKIKLKKGRLFKVDLAPAEDEYLDWDKPLSEQSEKVAAALSTILSVDRRAAIKARMLNRYERILRIFDDEFDIANINVWKTIHSNIHNVDHEILVDWAKTPGGEQERKVATSEIMKSKSHLKNLDEMVDLWEKINSDEWASVNAYETLTKESTGRTIYERTLQAVTQGLPGRRIRDDARDASLKLREAGIRGIRYLEGTAREAGDIATDLRVKAWPDGGYEVRAYNDSGKIGEWYGLNEEDVLDILRTDKDMARGLMKKAAAAPMRSVFADRPIKMHGIHNYVIFDDRDVTVTEVYQKKDATTDKFKANESKVILEINELFNRIAPQVSGVKLVRAQELKVEGGYGGIRAYYLPLQDVIKTALRWEDPVGSFRHEVIHHLRNMGMFRDHEWNALQKMAVKWRDDYQIDENYAIPYNEAFGEARAEELMNEEAIAEAFRMWKMGQATQPKGIERIFRRILEFFEGVQRILYRNGFRNWEDVFKDIERGYVGARPKQGPLFAQTQTGTMTPVSRIEKHAEAYGNKIAKLYNRVPGDPDQERVMNETFAGRTDPHLHPIQAARNLVHDWYEYFKQRFITDMVDFANPIRQFGITLQKAGEMTSERAARPWRRVHLTQHLPEVMATVLHNGMLKWDPESKWFTVDPEEYPGGFMGIFEDEKSGNLIDRGLGELWGGYVVAVRANRLLKEGKERLMSQEKIDHLLRLGEQYPEFERVRQKWSAFNKSLLDTMEASGLINKVERQIWERSDYVPFYRVLETEGEAQRRVGPYGTGFFKKKLTGGEEKLANPLQNIVLNMTHMVDQAFQNRAKLEIVEFFKDADLVGDALSGNVLEEIKPGWKSVHVSAGNAASQLRKLGVDVDRMTKDQREEWLKLWTKSLPRDPNVFVTFVDGLPHYYKVHDHDTMTVIANIKPKVMKNSMRLLGLPRRILTEMVTAAPAYMAANSIRDSIHTWVSTDTDIIPFIDTAKGAVKAYRKDPEVWKIMAAGGSVGAYYATAPSEVRSLIETGLGADRKGVINNAKKAYRAWRRVGEIAENANRMAVFNDMKKRGFDDEQAAFAAMDVLNFGSRGRSDIARFMTTIIPFWNARVQGLYRLGRGASANLVSGGDQVKARKKFLIRGIGLTGMSLGLLALNWDDDRYQQLSDWDRKAYYHIYLDNIFPAPILKALGVDASDWHIAIPKPFEVGVLFSTLPEEMVRALRDDVSGKDAAKNVMELIRDQLNLIDIPQAIKPVMEIYMNRSLFTGGPIVPERIAGRIPKAQYTGRTSETAKAIGDMFNLSPVKIDHLARGYMGNIGSYLMMSTNAILGDVEKPAWRMDRIPEVGRFVRTHPLQTTRYLQKFYEMKNEVEAVHQTMKAYRKERARGKERELRQDEREATRFYKEITKTGKRISDINQRINEIEMHPSLPAESKTARLERLYQQRNRLAERVVKRLGERL